VLVATDFFTAEVWTLGGMVTYYVLFFIHLGSRKVEIAGMTPHPSAAWMGQVARNVTIEEWGFLTLATISSMTATGNTALRFSRSSTQPGSRGCHCRRDRQI